MNEWLFLWEKAPRKCARTWSRSSKRTPFSSDLAIFSNHSLAGSCVSICVYEVGLVACTVRGVQDLDAIIQFAPHEKAARPKGGDSSGARAREGIQHEHGLLACSTPCMLWYMKGVGGRG